MTLFQPLPLITFPKINFNINLGLNDHFLYTSNFLTFYRELKNTIGHYRVFSPQVREIKCDIDPIIVVPLRDIPYNDAKEEIEFYIKSARGRKVFISEIAEELHIDIEVICKVFEEIQNEGKVDSD